MAEHTLLTGRTACNGARQWMNTVHDAQQLALPELASWVLELPCTGLAPALAQAQMPLAWGQVSQHQGAH